MLADPIDQFRVWLDEAEEAEVAMPIAMTLATADREGRVSARVVLLRGIDERGFMFFTNYESDKGADLEVNPSAALVFHWQLQGRQVRVEGKAEVLTEGESDIYFSTRPRGNQLAAHASPQSMVLADRQELVGRFDQVEDQFKNRDVPRPDNWGGYRVVPDMVEFWQEAEHRLHDRLRYRLSETGEWVLERLGA